MAAPSGVSVAATTSLTTPDDDDEMIDITPRSSPGEMSHHFNTYSRGSTADNSDMERERGDYHHHQQQQQQPQHPSSSSQQHRTHPHVPTHSAFGDSMDGKFSVHVIICTYVRFIHSHLRRSSFF